MRIQSVLSAGYYNFMHVFLLKQEQAVESREGNAHTYNFAFSYTR